MGSLFDIKTGLLRPLPMHLFKVTLLYSALPPALGPLTLPRFQFPPQGLCTEHLQCSSCHLHVAAKNATFREGLLPTSAHQALPSNCLSCLVPCFVAVSQCIIICELVCCLMSVSLPDSSVGQGHLLEQVWRVAAAQKVIVEFLM